MVFKQAMDKARTSTDPTEIEHYFGLSPSFPDAHTRMHVLILNTLTVHSLSAMLREKNQQEAAEIDAVFLEKNNRVRAIADMEHEMERLRQV
jgi:hypothetical protein